MIKDKLDLRHFFAEGPTGLHPALPSDSTGPDTTTYPPDHPIPNPESTWGVHKSRPPARSYPQGLVYNLCIAVINRHQHAVPLGKTRLSRRNSKNHAWFQHVDPRAQKHCEEVDNPGRWGVL